MDRFYRWMEEESTRDVPEEVRALYHSFCNTLPNKNGIKGGVFYGSALWKSPDSDSIWDMYILIDRYADATDKRLIQLAGICLPPNVYYHETSGVNGNRIRGKIALMQLSQFEKHCAGFALSPQIWARFSQPARLIATQDDAAKQQIIMALKQAVVTFHKKTAPWITTPCSVAEFWKTGLNRTYASEFRVEKTQRHTVLVESSLPSFITRSTYALSGTEVTSLRLEQELIVSQLSPQKQRICRAISSAKCYLSKIQHLLRLMKAAFTFAGGIDYLVYKIERHSGVKLNPSQFQKKHPIISLWGTFIKGLQNRTFR